mmetsp:Transcript_12682/g.26839  ORF Transcript_12682/g.26839 Transcript_12682/m.26839 type:complete len:205 (-) Transcript_12682:208-822(-)
MSATPSSARIRPSFATSIASSTPLAKLATKTTTATATMIAATCPSSASSVPTPSTTATTILNTKVPRSVPVMAVSSKKKKRARCRMTSESLPKPTSARLRALPLRMLLPPLPPHLLPPSPLHRPSCTTAQKPHGPEPRRKTKSWRSTGPAVARPKRDMLSPPLCPKNQDRMMPCTNHPPSRPMVVWTAATTGTTLYVLRGFNSH